MNRIIVAFVPVLHAGYIQLFKKYPKALYLLGPTYIKAFPRLERDIRALHPLTMQKAIGALGVVKDVYVLDAKHLEKLQGDDVSFVIPDEDIMHDFAKKHLPEKDIIFDTFFLRWDKRITDREYEVSPDRVISTAALDREMMSRALREAQKSSDWWRQIGALVVKNGETLFQSHNRHLPSDHHLYAFGDPRSNFDAGERPDVYTSIHAEADIIAQAARNGVSLLDASLYITTFPCPNCARLLAQVGIKKVYYTKGYSLLDAEQIFKTHNIEIVLVEMGNPSTP